MNRMFFSQSFSIFENYLCDAFLKLVFFSVENQKKFVTCYKEKKELDLSVFELLQHHEMQASEIIKRKLTEVIKKTLFHKLEKVLLLYQIYGIDFLKANPNLGQLFNSVKYRHHAVHRNGADMDGKKLDVYTKPYIILIMELMLQVAQYIDKELKVQMSEETSPKTEPPKEK